MEESFTVRIATSKGEALDQEVIERKKPERAAEQNKQNPNK